MATTISELNTEVIQDVHQLNPLVDSRWGQFVSSDPRSSVFHSDGWLRALRATYGYEPVVFTGASPDQRLTNAVLFCRVNSWITGKRLVSLPFSDHCEPLVESPAQLQALLAPAREELRGGRIKYIDIRPLSLEFSEGLQHPDSFFIHLLDLRPPVEELYKKLHGDSIRRKIQRAER